MVMNIINSKVTLALLALSIFSLAVTAHQQRKAYTAFNEIYMLNSTNISFTDFSKYLEANFEG